MRLHSNVTTIALLLWVLGFTPPSALGQEIASRQPAVSDWRVFHRNNDEHWARMVTATSGWRGIPSDRTKVRLAASDVREMRLLAGISDDEPSDPILALVGGHMKDDQFLMETVRPGECLNLTVFGKRSGHFEKLWSIAGLPNGTGMCQPHGCDRPRVSVDEKHEIKVVAFLRSSPGQPVCDQFSSATYVPKGSSFELKNEDSGKSVCWFHEYAFGLNSAFARAAGPGETLAIVQNRPALSSDQYAIVLQRRTSGLRLLLMRLQPELWLWATSRPQEKATATECYSQATSVPVIVNSIEVPQDRAQALATTLDHIDLRSDRCPRNPDFECAFLLDGRGFYVEVRDHPPVLLTDVGGLKGYSSENPPLSEWVYRLLGEAKQVSRTAAK